MPLLKGWGTEDRRLCLHLVHAIDGQLARDRVDRVPSNPELLRARVELLSYVKRGGTSATHATEPGGTKSVPQTSPIGMMSVKVTSSVLGYSESYTRRLCRLRTLPAIQIRDGGAWHIDAEAVKARRQKEQPDE